MEKCRAQAGSQEAAAAAQLRPSGRRRGGGARGGGEAAPRGPRRPGDWARDGAGRAEGNKLRSRFRAGERWTSSGERQERQRGRKEGEKGRRGPGDSGAAASRSRRSRDGLTAVARADPQPQGTKKGEGGEGGESGALQRAGRRRGRARAGGGGGASASAAHPGTRAPRSAAAAAALWQALVGERCARGPRSPLSRPSHACRVGGRPGAGARTSVTSCGGALPVMWLEAGGEEGKAGRGRRKCEGSREGGSARGARVLAKGGVGPWIGSLAGEEEQRNSLSVSEPPGCRTKKKTGKIQVLREAVKGICVSVYRLGSTTELHGPSGLLSPRCSTRRPICNMIWQSQEPGCKDREASQSWPQLEAWGKPGQTRRREREKEGEREGRRRKEKGEGREGGGRRGSRRGMGREGELSDWKIWQVSADKL